MTITANDNLIAYELDEPAAMSHTPLGWSIQTIELSPSGKAPKRYGTNTYRFGASLTLSAILPRRGWSLVKNTKSYVYLIPPLDQSNPPFHISIAIPSQEECLALARRYYAKGQSWIGQLGEWPAWYLHERNTDMREMWRDPTTGEMASKLHHNPPESSLSIGEWGVWDARVTGIAGNFSLGLLAQPTSPNASISKSHEELTLLEGALRSLELTAYERNATARRRCIEHYGPTCQICGLVYENIYGPIAADLIHVHHLTPLSSIGTSYEVDPIRDLIPLCATCHHVVHSRMPPYSIAEVQQAILTQTTDRK